MRILETIPTTFEGFKFKEKKIEIKMAFLIKSAYEKDLDRIE